MRRFVDVRLGVVFLLVACLACSGCGRARYPVTGRAAFGDGSAYTGGGFVIAEATIDGKPVSARAEIAKDGTFTLLGRGEGDGVLQGTYRVRLIGPRNSGDIDAGALVPLPFHKKFAAFDTSGLTLEIGSGKNELVIDLGDKP